MTDRNRRTLIKAIEKYKLLQAEHERLRSRLAEPIAIVGMACRLPGGLESPEAFWRFLEEGGDAIEEFPPDRWDVAAIYDPDPDRIGTSYAKEGGFLRRIDRFDATFFGIGSREAASMDPQQRLVLEVAWEALERSGIDPLGLARSRGGVYLGSLGSDYRGSGLSQFDGFVATGNSSSVLSGRVAYVLGLEGPAMTIDTACSSSLVGLHLAVQGLRGGECDLAIAGGVTIMTTPAPFIEFSRLRGMAPDGRCKSFGATADGAGWSEGVAVLILERLSVAREKGHPVLAVIRGSAVNQDGRSQGLTAPHGPSQERAILDALARSGLGPEAIDCVEAHGTGTSLGDPIEAGALAAVFGPGRAADRPLWLGSSKSNLGHAQAAAGAIGVIKMVLALGHERLPRTLHAAEPSPHIEWDGSGLALLQEAVDWPRGERVRRAGVSAFGLSGTNAHLILEEAPAPVPATEPVVERAPRPVPLLVLSARSEAALRRQAGRYAAHIESHPEMALADICHSAAVHRAHLERRLSVLAGDRRALIEALEGYATSGEHPAVSVGSDERPRVVFVYPGQGSQWAGMGTGLLATSPVFRESVRACDEAVRAEAGWSVVEALETGRFDGIEVVQPVLFTMAIGLAAVWRDRGVEPDLVVGHSQGEVAAACVAGALSLEDAVAVICRRSALLGRIAGRGAMALLERSVEATAELLVPYGDGLSIAVSNSPASTVVSGEAEAIESLLAEMESSGVFARRIQVDVASHSRQVEELREDLLARLEGIEPRRGRIPIVSTVTGERVDGSELDAGYWYGNLRQPVRFGEVMENLWSAGPLLAVEVSPHPLLSVALAEVQGGRGGGVVGSLRRGDDEEESLAWNLGLAHGLGARVDRERVLPGRRVDLPTYPFAPERHWLEFEGGRSGRPARPQAGRLLGPRVSSPLASVQFESLLGGRELSGYPTPEGRGGPAALLGLALEAVEAYRPGEPVRIEEAVEGRVFAVGSEECLRVQVIVTPLEAERADLGVHIAGEKGASQSTWHRVLGARLYFDPWAVEVPQRPVFDSQPPTSLWRGESTHVILVGLLPGEAGHWVRIALRDGDGSHVGPCHPALLPSLAMVAARCGQEEPTKRWPRITGWSSVRWQGALPDEWIAHLAGIDASTEAGQRVVFDATVFDLVGRPVARLEGVSAEWVGPEGEADVEDPTDVLQEVLIARATPRIAGLGLDADLLSAGMDSLMLLAVMNEFAARLGVRSRSSSSWTGRREGFTKRDIVEWVSAAPEAPSSSVADPVPAGPVQPASGAEAIGGRYDDVFVGDRPESLLWRDAAGLVLETVSIGQGETLTVLLPPFGCELSVWRPIMERLARTRRVLAVNLPGFGASPYQAAADRVEVLARAVEALLGRVGTDLVVDLVGWSLGGFVAQVIAASGRLRLRSLALVNTTDHLGIDGVSLADQEALLLRMETDLWRSLAALPPAEAAALEGLIFRGKSSRSPLVIAQSTRIIAAFDHRREGAKIEVPTSIIAGSEDLPVPLFHARRLHSSIAGSGLVVLPGVGHYAPIFRIDEVFEILLSASTGEKTDRPG